MRVLGFGTYDTDKHPRVGIILDGLRAHGDDVVEANAPLGMSTADRVTMLSRPWTVYRLIARLLNRWWHIGRHAHAARRRRPFDAVIVGYLGHFDVVLARLLFPRDTVVLDLLVFAADTARDRGTSSRWRLRLLGALDRLAVRCASIVLVDTEEHVDLIQASQRSKAIVVPVGAGEEWFVAGWHAKECPSSDRLLRVVFFGLFTPLQGTVVIGMALRELADIAQIRTTMIGAGQDLAAAREASEGNPHVTWTDWVEPGELPTLVARHDVCLGIFGATPKALRVVPNKVYQGAAAGCAVLTSDTPPQRRALGDAAAFVPPGDASALARALGELAAEPERVAQLRAAAVRRSAAFAASEIVVGLRRHLAAQNAPNREGPASA